MTARPTLGAPHFVTARTELHTQKRWMSFTPESFRQRFKCVNLPHPDHVALALVNFGGHPACGYGHGPTSVSTSRLGRCGRCTRSI
jgi:hypothetical protein